MQTPKLDYEHVVIGAGVEGSCTAFYLAKEGKRTLLIDQFSLHSSKGSSQGSSRIIRRAYAEEYYACLMNEAYEEWEQIERESNRPLLMKTGLLLVCQPPYEILEKYISTFEKFKHPYEIIDHDALKSRFPSLNYGPEYRAVYEPDAGILQADRCLLVIQALFASLGGKVAGNEEVINIEPKGCYVNIQTTKRSYTAASVVICAGPWTSCLLPKIGLHLPISAKIVGMFYWPASGDDYSFEKCPNIMDVSSENRIYAIPAMEFPRQMKVCFTYPEIPDDGFDPTLKKTYDFDTYEQLLKPYIEEHFPKLRPTPSIKCQCYYTLSPDHAFIMDYHPQHRNIVIATGFSGTGFKLGPVVGKILRSLATHGNHNYNLKPFSISRFHSKQQI